MLSLKFKGRAVNGPAFLFGKCHFSLRVTTKIGCGSGKCVKECHVKRFISYSILSSILKI
jgi:hypothetical protein